jgi:hypothetical protein
VNNAAKMLICQPKKKARDVSGFAPPIALTLGIVGEIITTGRVAIIVAIMAPTGLGKDVAPASEIITPVKSAA